MVAPIERGSIDAYRVFSGSLEASASFVVASKIGGRVKSVLVDIGDEVQPGQKVVIIDDAEYKQAKEQARADLLVAQANLMEAQNLLTITERSMERTKTLSEKGVASAAELDSSQSDLLAKQAKVAVLEAQVVRAKAELKTSNIQLGYAVVDAVWSDAKTPRVVAERFVDEGEVVQANTPLLRIVELKPINAIFFVPEKDYGSLHIGQSVTLHTDAYPDTPETGTIARIAPVFQDSSRQARVEVTIPNETGRLKPGMFVRADVKVDTAASVVIVPTDAIVTRDDTQGIFIVKPGTKIVRWRSVTVGIQHGDNVEVTGTDLTGQVVILGQQLVKDGSRVSISEASSETRTPESKREAP